MPQDGVGQTFEGFRGHVPEDRQRRVQDWKSRHRGLPAGSRLVHAGVHVHRRSGEQASVRVRGCSQSRGQVQRRRHG